MRTNFVVSIPAQLEVIVQAESEDPDYNYLKRVARQTMASNWDTKGLPFAVKPYDDLDAYFISKEEESMNKAESMFGPTQHTHNHNHLFLLLEWRGVTYNYTYDAFDGSRRLSVHVYDVSKEIRQSLEQSITACSPDSLFFEAGLLEVRWSSKNA